MTWQRIDDDTYIDDTLVTFAEYQLFIDEMREQGKYYQPDHWTSYRFPQGQAHEPTLGMRHSDAVVFCEWLTRQCTYGWKYRLPCQEEVDTSLLQFSIGTPIGYWLNEPHGFSWIGIAPQSPRKLDLFYENEIERDIRAYNDLRMLSQNKYINLNLDRKLGPLSLEKSLVEFQDISFELARRLDGKFKLDFSQAQQIVTEISLVRDIQLKTIQQDVSDYYAEILSRVRKFKYFFVRARYQEPVLNQPLESAHVLALRIFTDIYTLQERIAGRSPAFEGIRLVKERIK